MIKGITYIIQKWDLDLSKVDLLLQDKYSVYGPKPRQPSCMFRSLLLAPKFKVTSVTSWVLQMQITPLYALLSGFSPDDVPGVGTFYESSRKVRTRHRPSAGRRGLLVRRWHGTAGRRLRSHASGQQRSSPPKAADVFRAIRSNA